MFRSKRDGKSNLCTHIISFYVSEQYAYVFRDVPHGRSFYIYNDTDADTGYLYVPDRYGWEFVCESDDGDWIYPVIPAGGLVRASVYKNFVSGIEPKNGQLYLDDSTLQGLMEFY